MITVKQFIVNLSSVSFSVRDCVVGSLLLRGTWRVS